MDLAADLRGGPSIPHKTSHGTQMKASFLLLGIFAASVSAFTPSVAHAASVTQARVPAQPIVMAAKKGGVKQTSSSFGGSGAGGRRAPGAGQTVGGVIESVGTVSDFIAGEGITAPKVLIPLWLLFVGHSLGAF